MNSPGYVSRRDQDFVVHWIDYDTVWPQQLGPWSLDDPNRRFLSLRSAAEGQNRLGKLVGDHDFIMDFVIINAVHCPPQKCFLS